jgi:hypothetical protein
MNLHEAICVAAGWQAYCDLCNAQMKRGFNGSYCPNKDRHPKDPDVCCDCEYPLRFDSVLHMYFCDECGNHGMG